MTTSKPKKRPDTKKNEVLLLTCGPVIGKEIMKRLADEWLGFIFEDATGYHRVMKTRISGKRIYGSHEAVQESSYMFF